MDKKQFFYTALVRFSAEDSIEDRDAIAKARALTEVLESHVEVDLTDAHLAEMQGDFIIARPVWSTAGRGRYNR